MHSRNEDIIAIHTVAVGAVNILKDLVGRDGENFATRAARIGLFEIALKRLGMRLPKDRVIPPMIDKFIDSLAEGISKGYLKSANDIIMPSLNDVDFLAYIRSPANFLKHADRDPDAILNETDFLAAEALVAAIAAYNMQFPRDPLPAFVANWLGSRSGWKLPSVG